MLNKIMATLSSISVPGNLEMNKLNSQILIEGVESKVYKPIMKRQLCGRFFMTYFKMEKTQIFLFVFKI